jgi:hypothetical protein
MDGNPLRKKKVKSDEDVEKWKKVKPRISAGAAKAMVGIKAAPDVSWIERWIEDLCRTNSWPLQLVCSDFVGKLGSLLAPPMALSTLEKLRADYHQAHPFASPKDDYGFLEGISPPKVDE